MYASDSGEEDEDEICMKATTATIHSCVQKKLGAELHPSDIAGFADKEFTTETQVARQDDNDKTRRAHVHALATGSKLIDHHDIELEHSMHRSVLTLEDTSDGEHKFRRGGATLKSSTIFERFSETQQSVESKHQSYASWETFAKAWLP